MKIDLGSFAFGSSIVSGGNTPSWGTSLGQQRPGLKFTYAGFDNIIIGMMYNSIPVDKVYIPLGKGGHVCNSLEDEGIQLAALFDKVYINDKKVNTSFILLLYKESSGSWQGRRTLKYNVKIEYHKDENTIISNANFVNAATEALNIASDACWVISDIYILNQDELHFVAGIVNPEKSEVYESSELRKTAFINAIDTTYESNPNLLKKFASDKLEAITDNSKLPVDSTFQQIYYGAPGTGKSHIINELTKGESVVRTTFHPDSDYSTFVGSYKPTTREIPMRDVTGKVIYENGGEVTENRVVYEFVPQAFLQAYVDAWKHYAKATEEESAKKQFLIIEEINRGNCAQIFGDLFQLLDRGDDGFSDYPIHADKDLQKYLAKAFDDLPQFGVPAIGGIGSEEIATKVRNGEILLLPNNLYIWATMNTSDQSLFPIDSAFKRRWDWQYMPICKGRNNVGDELNWSINVDETEYDWWDFINKINARIGSTTNSEDKKLGFFFCKAKQGKISAETFVGKVIFYLWNDVFKDFGFDNTIFNDDEGETLSFNKFYATNIEGKVVVRLDKVEKFLQNLEVEVVSSNAVAEEDTEEAE